jgi:hypothetical protein
MIRPTNLGSTTFHAYAPQEKYQRRHPHSIERGFLEWLWQSPHIIRR